LQDDANRYRRFVKPDGKVAWNCNDNWCRRDEQGNPDYTDPRVFPQAWPAV
jgi:hypothetical protein